MRRLVGVFLVASACTFSHGSTGTDAKRTDADADGSIDMMTNGLVSRSLVVRYFIDEAASGQVPPLLLDDAPSPLALDLHYTQSLAFAEAGTRALRWSAVGDTGRPSAPLGGTKLETALAGAQRWTYELVVDLQAALNAECRLISIGYLTTTYGTAALITNDLTSLRLHVGVWSASWKVTFGRRVVIHAVVDTTLATPAERFRLFVDGVESTLSGLGPPPQGTGLMLQPGDFLALGNVEGSPRSFAGDLFYAAIYADALAPEEIAANVARLATNDDH